MAQLVIEIKQERIKAVENSYSVYERQYSPSPEKSL